MRKTALLTGVACLFVGVAAYAQTWVDLGSPSGKFVFHIDADSVAPSGAGRYSVTWRQSTSLEQSYFIKQATIDCAIESLELTTSTHVVTELLPLGQATSVTDYVA